MPCAGTAAGLRKAADPQRVVAEVADPRQRLIKDLASNAAHVARLEFEFARVVAASESSNADDEHDPEGPTIAYERQQLVALLQQARHAREDVEWALGQLDEGRYGVCQRCGVEIAAERLAACPAARTCISCAPGRVLLAVRPPPSSSS